MIARLQVLAQRHVLGDQLAPLDRVLQDDQHLVVLERLGDVVERALLHRRDRAFHRRVGGDHQDRQFLVVLLQLVEDLQPVDAGHHHVDDDGIERQRLGEVEAFLAGRGQAHAVALALQQRAQDVPHHFFVVDDEYCCVVFRMV